MLMVPYFNHYVRQANSIWLDVHMSFGVMYYAECVYEK